MIFVRQDEHQVGVGSQIEFAHAQASQRDHHELVAQLHSRARPEDARRPLDPAPSGRWRRWRRRPGRKWSRSVSKTGNAQAHAGGLDSKHLAPEEAAQIGNIFEMSGGFGERTSVARGPSRRAPPSIPGCGSALRQSTGCARKCRACSAPRCRSELSSDSHVGFGHHLLEKMFERAGAAPQAGARHAIRKLRRALGRETGPGCWTPASTDLRPLHFGGSRRRQVVVTGALRVDDALIDFLHGFQMRVQLMQQFLAATARCQVARWAFSGPADRARARWMGSV